MTVLHAGGKFGGGGYKVSGGLHGVGASVVNALSREMWVEVAPDGDVYGAGVRREALPPGYARGSPQDELGADVDRAAAPARTISFMPDREIFDSIEFDFDDRCCSASARYAYLTKGIWLRLFDERDGKESHLLLRGRHPELRPPPQQGTRSAQHRARSTWSARSTATSSKCAHPVQRRLQRGRLQLRQLINTIDGGSHLTGFRTALTRVLNDYARKTKILKDNDANLTGDDVREGLVAVVCVKLPEPQFEGQTKTRLGNPEVDGHVERGRRGLTQYLRREPGGRPPHHREVPHRPPAPARPRARPATSCSARAPLESGTLPGKLADCSDRDPEHSRDLHRRGRLSAGGSAKHGRDRRFQAILPLHGKILNVEKARARQDARPRRDPRS